ncbi:hypothetical protein Vadar_007083 [Vaccinium darrowii]|uniref:Uncharacterized protein n=1 Tax=Vaccinium darrowii TaxID=229202 RepID=A0ACB7X8A1_9ERIC|nr:hypothetical protein Vadar_007083 [Vaccinium darrowii]
MALLPQHLCRRILTPLTSTPPRHYNTAATLVTRTIIPFISISSRFHHIQPLPLLFSTSPPKPTSKFPPFSLFVSGSRSISHATVPVNVGYDEEKGTTHSSKLRILKQKVEGRGINCDSWKPGQHDVLICPKCNGGQSLDKGLSFHISKNGDFATWKCFRVECSWTGQVVAEDSALCNRVEVNCTGLMTVESLRLVPLGEKIISYFAERKISENTLRRNAVMQTSGDQNAIAFIYRQDGALVHCKYRSLDKKFWQTKNKEKILYGLDDIKGADEIIIVEGEIDKLSMEEAGFISCVSVPDGAPQKVSAKLPLFKKDSRFQYLWNCKEHLDKASRIILATDGDPPGNVLAEELACRLGKERCWRVCWPKKDELSYYKDANEILMNLGSAALRDVVHRAELYLMHS